MTANCRDVTTSMTANCPDMTASMTANCPDVTANVTANKTTESPENAYRDRLRGISQLARVL
jgi:hypothetical protein